MCVIATAGKGAMPTIGQLARMSETNPDGAGIAWHDGTGLHRYRNPDNNQTLAFIIKNWRTLGDMPCLMHFRFATHGATTEENTHPFRYRLSDGEHGFIAHRYAKGRYTSDSRNAILAWQSGQTDLTDGSQGRFAKIDQNGRIEWLHGGQPIQGERGTIMVSNANWLDHGIDDMMGYDDGQRELLDGAIPDWTPRRR